MSVGLATFLSGVTLDTREDLSPSSRDAGAGQRPVECSSGGSGLKRT
ncbi:7030_t:CDS:1, partial [Acaulospora colombiana]